MNIYIFESEHTHNIFRIWRRCSLRSLVFNIQRSLNYAEKCSQLTQFTRWTYDVSEVYSLALSLELSWDTSRPSFESLLLLYCVCARGGKFEFIKFENFCCSFLPGRKFKSRRAGFFFLLSDAIKNISHRKFEFPFSPFARESSPFVFSDERCSCFVHALLVGMWDFEATQEEDENNL